MDASETLGWMMRPLGRALGTDRVLRPVRHFTDHEMRVHLFTCVLALAIAHLMRREAARAGLALSVPALLGELDGIGETVLLYQGERGRPRARHTTTKMTPPSSASTRSSTSTATPRTAGVGNTSN